MDEASGQTAEDAAPRVGPRLAPLESSGCEPAGGPDEVAREEAQHPQVAPPQVLRVEEALAARVADVQPLQLCRAPPIVVLDDEGRLVAERLSGFEPPVAELVVLGRFLGAETLVETSEVERGRARDRH